VDIAHEIHFREHVHKRQERESEAAIESEEGVGVEYACADGNNCCNDDAAHVPRGNSVVTEYKRGQHGEFRDTYHVPALGSPSTAMFVDTHTQV